MNPEMLTYLALRLSCSIEQSESRFVKMLFPWGGTLLFEESRGRMIISGSFPRSDGNYWAPHGESHSISISATKSPEQSAHDITVRLLPNYRAAYELAVVRMNEYDAARARQEVLAKRLADLAGGKVSSQDPLRFFRYDPHVEGRINSEDVTLKMTCSIELAERILREVAK